MSISKSSWECIAFDGQRVPHGENYVPGPDNCTACKCEKGKPHLCRAALCQPPQDCKSFRVGDSCCDFICLDDILPTLNKDIGNGGPSDAGLRMVASAITAFLSLALLLFLIHRLRQRKLRTAQHQYFEDQLDALGGLPGDSCRNNPCCHNAIYLTGNDHVDFFLDGHTPPFTPWKPPSYYFQPGDAPPPYSEVMANDRMRSEGPLSSLNPMMVQLSAASDSIQAPHGPQRPCLSQRNSSLILDSPTGTDQTREPGPAIPVQQTNPVTSSALLSDEVYESSTYTDGNERTSSQTMPNPAQMQSLNDLNRGMSQSSSDASEFVQEAMESNACRDDSCHCVCSHNLEKCNVCSGAQRSSLLEKSTVKRTRPISSDTERESTVKDFRLRLRLDISASSTSTDETSHPVSFGSTSSRSSADVPSIESNHDASC